MTRRPNIIHVAGKYAFFRSIANMSIHNKVTGVVSKLTEGQFYPITTDADLQSIVWTLDQLQQRATASGQILFSYNEIINKVNELWLIEHSFTVGPGLKVFEGPLAKLGQCLPTSGPGGIRPPCPFPPCPIPLATASARKPAGTLRGKPWS